VGLVAKVIVYVAEEEP
jgi:hypothetical protein